LILQCLLPPEDAHLTALGVLECKYRIAPGNKLLLPLYLYLELMIDPTLDSMNFTRPCSHFASWLIVYGYHGCLLNYLIFFHMISIKMIHYPLQLLWGYAFEPTCLCDHCQYIIQCSIELRNCILFVLSTEKQGGVEIIVTLTYANKDI